MDASENTMKLLADYLAAKVQFTEHIRNRFPKGSFVKVMRANHHIIGKVHNIGEDHPETVGLILERGQVRWFHFGKDAIEEATYVPEWFRRQVG